MPEYFASLTTVQAFVDESGDLGFNDSCSRYFVVAYIVPKEPERTRTMLGRFAKELKIHHKVGVSLAI